MRYNTATDIMMIPMKDVNTRLWGYADVYGQWKIQPEFKYCQNYYDGIARAEISDGGKRIVVVIDRSGSILCRFAVAGLLHKGGLLGIDEQSRLLFCDSNGPRLVSDRINANAEIRCLTRSTFMLEEAGRRRFVDCSDEPKVIDMPHNLTFSTREGEYCERIDNISKECFFSIKDGRGGPLYDGITSEWSEGYCVIFSKDAGRYYINLDYNNIFEQYYFEAHAFRFGMAPVRIADRNCVDYRYLYRDGKLTDRLPYYSISPFYKCGAAVVEADDGERFLINRNLELISGPYYAVDDHDEGDFPYLVCAAGEGSEEAELIVGDGNGDVEIYAWGRKRN